MAELKTIYHVEGKLCKDFIGQISYTVCLDQTYEELDIEFSFGPQHFRPEDVTPELKGLVDTISISLNTPNAERYHELVRSKFGDQSFDAMIDFAKKCTRHVAKVVMTTVETTITKEEEAQCSKICEEIGAVYRIRPWED